MQRVPVPLRQRLVDLLRGPVALLVWVAAAGGACWFLLRRPLPVAHVAWVPPRVAVLAAPADGRVEDLHVRPHQPVRRGEVLGRLDDGPLRARLATELARVEELRQRVVAARAAAADEHARAALEFDLARREEARAYDTELRRYVGDEAELALDLLALEVEIADARVEIERLDVRLRRARSLVEDGIGPVADVEDLTLAKRQVEERLARAEVQRDRTRVELEAASARLAAFRAEAPPEVSVLPPTDALAGLEAAVEVQRRAVEEVRAELDRLALVAPADGVVAAIVSSAGEYVVRGREILRVVAAGAEEAVLYVDPALAHEDLVGRAVELRRLGTDELLVATEIVSVAPHVELLPERLWTSPDLPRYGRAALLPLAGTAGFVPGEVLGARLVR